MGILDKIEDKLSGSSHNKQTAEGQHGQQVGRTSLDNQHGSQGHNTLTKPNPLQNPVQSGHGLTGQGLTGSTGSGAVPGAFPGSGHQSSETTGYGHDSTGVHSATDRLQNTTLGGQQSVATASQYSGEPGLTSSSTHNTARQPYDPYSSKGQQLAAAAGVKDSSHGTSHLSSGRNDPQEYGSRSALDPTTHHGTSQLSSGRNDAQDYGSRSTHDPTDVSRTRHGGVSNGLAEPVLHSGPHSSMENHDAIPTAGGQKVGNLDQPYGGQGTSQYDDSRSSRYAENPSKEHHYGRDAAAIGGTSAIGTAIGHRSHDHDRHRDQSSYLNNPSTTGAYDQSGTSRSQYEHTGSSTHGTGLPSRHQEPEISYMKNRQEPHTSTTHREHESQGHRSGESGGVMSAVKSAVGMGSSNHGREHRSGEDTYSSSHDRSGHTGSSSTGAYGSSHQTSSSSVGTPGGMSLARKLGAAYEAGYRDAMEHFQAEQRR